MFSPYCSLFDALLRPDHLGPVEPLCNLYQDHDVHVVQVQMPGVSRDAIDIQVVHGILKIHGKSVVPGTPDPDHQEFRATEYSREFRVSDEVDVAAITAQHQDGVLTLRVPRGKSSQAHKIQIT